MARKKLGEMLVEAGVLTEASVRAALAEQRRWGGTLGRTLIEMKLIGEEDLVLALSRQLGLQPVDLDRVQIPSAVLDLVPGELAQQWSLVPFAQPMKFLDVATADPTNLGVLDELRIRTQLNIRPFLAGPKAIERALARCYGRGFHGFDRSSSAIAIPIDTMDLNAATPSAAPMAADGLRTFPRTKSLTAAPPVGVPPPAGSGRDPEVIALQNRVSQLEARVQRDEEVLRKLLALLIEKNVATRDEIVARIS